MSAIGIYLLGSPYVTVDGRVGQIHRRQSLGLLAYLAIQGGPHSRDSLTALFWPDQDQAHSRAELRRTISALNKDLGVRLVDGDRENVSVAASADLFVDVLDFLRGIDGCSDHATGESRCSACGESRRHAVGLYRGTFMSGVTLRNSPAFDSWQWFQADHLSRRTVEGLLQLARAAASAGDHAHAIEYARSIIGIDSTCEAAHRVLIEEYAKSDQRAAALRQFRECERLLAEELDAKPSRETLALVDRVRVMESATTTKSLSAFPVPTTPCLGRDAELAELAGRLGDDRCRLITLVGPGGIGKTRLALEAAVQASSLFADSALLVNLTTVASEEGLVTSLAAAVGMSIDEGVDPVASLQFALSPRAMLLVLDNFDQLTMFSGLLVDVLERAPRLKILVTSRERLSVRGEWILEVTGLEVPPRNIATRDVGAVQLFLIAARRSLPSFDPSDDELVQIGRICRLVGGMPLGLELAAGWTRFLECSEIAKEIEAGIGFLETQMRDVPERHRSIRALFESSWQLLSEEERRVFRALGVFKGGWSRLAAEEITRASLTTMSVLADRSLLHRVGSGRYELHELLRQSATEKLGENPNERDSLHVAHCHYFTSTLARFQASLERDDLTAVIALREDVDNLRAAWWWAVDTNDFAGLGRALDAFFRFCDLQGWLEEGKKAFAGASDALERSGDSALLGRALAREAAFCSHLGLYDRARLRLERAVRLLEVGGAESERALALNRLGVVVHQMGDHEESWRLLEESLAISRGLGESSGIARSLGSMGYVAGELKRYEEAERLLEESLELNRLSGRQKKIATALNDLGYIVYLLGSLDRAESLLEESLAIRRDIGHKKGVAVTLGLLGWVAEGSGNLERARGTYQESLAVAVEMGATPVVLDVLVGLAKLMLFDGNSKEAAEILRLGASHPSGWDDTRRTAAELLAPLEQLPAPAADARVLRRSLESAIARCLRTGTP